MKNRIKGVENILENIYLDYPEEARAYLEPVAMPEDEYLKNWVNEDYLQKKNLDDKTSFITHKGEKVRSKSEIMIADALYKHGIPYKYERPLVLRNGNVIHPDFTIWDSKRNMEIYWEHRGMMDDRGYARDTVARLKELMQNEIVVGDNLIISEETSYNPLGTREIECLIRTFFEE